MNSKMIYVMNVDWNWIKQRPHFIAEGLSEKYDVKILYQHRYGRQGFQNRKDDKLQLRPIYVIPRGDRYRLTAKINKLIKTSKIKRIIEKEQARYLYLTFPEQVDIIPKDYNGIVVYDCMDNHPAFEKDERKKAIVIRDEQRMVNRSDIVIVTSEKLRLVLLERYGNKIKDKIHLVRNGYSGEILDIKNTTDEKIDDTYTLTYFGTLSSWFNFSFIEKSLMDFPNIKYELYGPISGISIPNYERLVYKGTVEHDKLLENIKDTTDCLIMPFIVNEIIESVDPVKLYEYINFKKNILCCEYDEIKRFAPFVNFYTDYNSYKHQIQKLIDNRTTIKYTEEQRKEFLKENNWEARVSMIHKLLLSFGD